MVLAAKEATEMSVIRSQSKGGVEPVQSVTAANSKARKRAKQLSLCFHILQN